MIFACPSCSQSLQLADDSGGKKVACPKCKQTVSVPQPAPAPPAPLAADGAIAPSAKEKSPATDRATSHTDTEREPEKSPSRGKERQAKPKVAIGADTLRVIVWLLVALWCLFPWLWMVVIMLGSIGRGDGHAGMGGGGFRPAADGIVMAVMTSALMLAAFMYALWCSLGVIIGVGFEKAITAVEVMMANVQKMRSGETGD